MSPSVRMFSAQCKIKHEGIQNASTFIYEILIRLHAYSKKYRDDKNLMLLCRRVQLGCVHI